MKSVSSIVAITALAGAVAGCAQEYSTAYPRYGYSQAAYYPATATYYSPGPRLLQCPGVLQRAAAAQLHQVECLFVPVGLLPQLPGHS